MGIEKAKQIALEKAGLTEDEVKFTEASFEIEKGNRIYEIEFRKGELEYSAEISAEDGTIISWEID
ncbi:MAG: PepSY domain-containing protein [Oscillospiraceae bacterium]|nr:PepSY domain-containing protein [Oscillospiraceae bacterium]